MTVFRAISLALSAGLFWVARDVPNNSDVVALVDAFDMVAAGVFFLPFFVVVYKRLLFLQVRFPGMGWMVCCSLLGGTLLLPGSFYWGIWHLAFQCVIIALLLIPSRRDVQSGMHES